MTTFPYPAASSSGDWAVTLPGGASIGEVIAYRNAPAPVVTTPITFSYTGTTQFFTVPAGVTVLDSIDAYGAQGGSGGLGGHVHAVGVPVTPGEVLTVEVGGAGQGPGGLVTSGGYNGGGNTTPSTIGDRGGGGGGFSGVRRGSTWLAIGGGGGGTGHRPGGDTAGVGGYGGYTHGGDGTYSLHGTPPGLGGTQTAGGAGSSGGHVTTDNGTAGTALQGGNGGGGGIKYGGGGGGGGWYGGGGGGGGQATGAGGGGGGGSSYEPGTAASVTYGNGVRTGNGEITISYTI